MPPEFGEDSLLRLSKPLACRIVHLLPSRKRRQRDASRRQSRKSQKINPDYGLYGRKLENPARNLLKNGRAKRRAGKGCTNQQMGVMRNLEKGNHEAPARNSHRSGRVKQVRKSPRIQNLAVLARSSRKSGHVKRPRTARTAIRRS